MAKKDMAGKEDAYAISAITVFPVVPTKLRASALWQSLALYILSICSYANIAYLALGKFSSMSVPGNFRYRAYGTIVRVSKNEPSER